MIHGAATSATTPEGSMGRGGRGNKGRLFQRVLRKKRRGSEDKRYTGFRSAALPSLSVSSGLQPSDYSARRTSNLRFC